MSDRERLDPTGGIEKAVLAAQDKAERERRPGVGPRRCAHGVELSIGCWECAAQGRVLAVAHAIWDLTKDVRFGGPTPTPAYENYARRVLEKAFDIWWAVDWIRSGYPEPPPWTAVNVEGYATEREHCGHVRQITPQGDILPCAYPACRIDGRAAGRDLWRTAHMNAPSSFRVYECEKLSASVPYITRTWQRVEWSPGRGGEHRWVWMELE